MKIALVSSEVVPYSKTGGLADVVGAVGKFLSLDGHDVRLFTPFYNTVDTSHGDFHQVDFLQNVPVDFNGEVVHFSVLSSRLPDSEADVYFIDAPRFFHRDKIYTDDADEYLRFALLSRAALECCQRMAWGPDIIHCNDWQTALIPLLLKSLYAWDGLFAGTKTVLTIHNLAYQGIFRRGVANHLGLEGVPLLVQDDLLRGIFNYLKHGILYADALTTVSETYAQEIQTPELGEGLQDLLRMRSDALTGIVNGVDYDEWNPEDDPLIPFHYDMEDPAGKARNKENLLTRMELPHDPAAPVFGIISRLVPQKGIELLYPILDPFLRHYNVRFCILGSGGSEYETFFELMQGRYPHKLRFYRGFSNELAHVIEAGADLFLMPSRYEPCGLNQIYSLRYGTIPIVRKTGGLADTVFHYDPHTGEGNGFVFQHHTSQGLAWAIEQALAIWPNRAEWGRLMRNAMSANWSWERQIDRYIEVYEKLLS